MELALAKGRGSMINARPSAAGNEEYMDEAKKRNIDFCLKRAYNIL